MPEKPDETVMLKTGHISQQQKTILGSGSVEQDSSPIFIGAMKKEEQTRLMHDH